MDQQELIERLAGHRIVGHVPREELAWVAEHGRVRRLEVGEVLSSRAKGVSGLFIILAGHISFYVTRANGRERVVEYRGGDVTGVLPYSRLVAPPGESVGEEPSDIVEVPRNLLPQLALACPEITAALVHVMVDRARQFTSSDLQNEKLLSLGKFSAGLAHELNNPVAAIARAAGSVGESVTAAEDAARALGALRLADDQLAAIAELRRRCVAGAVQVVRSPLQQADRESDIGHWLEEHGADPADSAALADTALELTMLDSVASIVTGPALSVVLRWLGTGCSVHQLALEIEDAAMRVTALVEAVKGFTHMDQNATAGPVDVAAGLSQTLAILKGKARAKGVAVDISVAAGLPAAYGIAGELNQIWANLIDNALDAAPASGHVAVTARAELHEVVVRVIDDGPGMPPEVQRRVFDPFFTTKKVGQGTGLGLDIVNRIVRKHHGSITVSSTPGRTEFAVSLPAASEAPKSRP